MKYDPARSRIKLESTGREFYANGDDLGVADPGEHVIYYGSDGGVETDDWTSEERAEVADEMIRRWLAWKSGR